MDLRATAVVLVNNIISSISLGDASYCFIVILNESGKKIFSYFFLIIAFYKWSIMLEIYLSYVFD